MQWVKMQISPEVAKELLKNNPMNRKLREAKIKVYTAAMNNGDWDEDSPEPIVLGTGGKILNGQNRLHAIIRANITLKLWVAKDVPDKVFKVLDQGASRTTGDIFSIKGIPNPGQTSGTIKMYLRIKDNYFGKQKSDALAGVYDTLVLSVYEKHPEYWNGVVEDAIRFNKQFNNMLSISTLGGFYAAMNDLLDKDAKHFMEKLTTGVGITNIKDPISLLRNYYMKEKTSTKKNPVEFNHIMMIKAWNFFRTKRTALLTYRKGEEPPKMI